MRLPNLHTDPMGHLIKIRTFDITKPVIGPWCTKVFFLVLVQKFERNYSKLPLKRNSMNTVQLCICFNKTRQVITDKRTTIL